MTASAARAPSGRKRAQLDRGVILASALDLAGQGQAVTFRALGTALGADPTAVYRHFRDKEELLGALFDRILQDVVGDSNPADSWRDQLLDKALRTLDAAEKYPSVGVEAMSLTTGGPGELGSVEMILEQFTAAGLDQAQAVRFYAVYSGYVLSTAAAVAAARLAAPLTASRADGSWIGDVGPVDPARYPAVAAARTELAALRDRDVFVLGIEAVLDAAEAIAVSARR